MTHNWEIWRTEICRLYRDENRHLHDVARIMQERHGFRAGQRSYRSWLKKWKCLKFAETDAHLLSDSSLLKFDETEKHLSSGSSLRADSGYGSTSQRASFSTFQSTTSRSSAEPSLDSIRTPGFMLQSTWTPEVSSTGDDSSLLQSNSYQDRPLPPLPDAVLPSSSGSHVTLTHPFSVSQSPADCSAHMQSSRCRIASTNAHAASAQIGFCNECGAGSLHSLMAVAPSLPLRNFEMLVKQDSGSISGCDIYGNTCVHAAAGARLSVEHFEILRKSGAVLDARNSDGCLFLHLINSAKNEDYLCSMLEWAAEQGIDLTSRSFDGETILHTFLANRIGWQSLERISNILLSAGEGINYRNRLGLTPIDYMKSAWRNSRRREYSSDTAMEHLDQFLMCRLPNFRSALGDELTNARNSPSPRCRSYEQYALSDKEMLEIVESSKKIHFVQDHRGRNALHCLAYIIRYTEYRYFSPQPPSARLERVLNCLGWGVDVNAYDSDGSTPLHSFLAEPRSNDDDNCLARIVEILLEWGAEPELRNRYGNSALHLACAHGRPASVTVLLAHLGRQKNGLEMHPIRAKNAFGRGICAETLAGMQYLDAYQIDLRRRCMQMIYNTGLCDETIGQEAFAPIQAQNVPRLRGAQAHQW